MQVIAPDGQGKGTRGSRSLQLPLSSDGVALSHLVTCQRLELQPQPGASRSLALPPPVARFYPGKVHAGGLQT